MKMKCTKEAALMTAKPGIQLAEVDDAGLVTFYEVFKVLPR